MDAALLVRGDISKTPAEFVGKAWSLVFDNEEEAIEYAELQLLRHDAADSRAHGSIE